MERTFSTEYRGAIDSFNFDLDELRERCRKLESEAKGL